MSSLARRAVRGAAWTILSSVGARLLGVVGTLVLTHLIAPDVIGEVSVATVLVLSANQFSSFGFGQFVVANPGLEAPKVFQVATLHLGFGVVGLAAVMLLAGPLTPLFDAPNMAMYVPGLAASVLLNRFSIIPERVLIRDLHFVAASVARTVGEITYVVTAVGLAYLDWGGEAIVLGNVTRSVIRTAIILFATDNRKWLAPSRLQGDLCRRVFRFGTPLWLGSSASFFSTKWDNLVFAGIFGPGELGLYTLGYNLADIPTSHVGEHIGDVLLPSFTRMDEQAQRHALVRSVALLALIVFPLAVGLGAVADTLALALFNQEWQGVAVYLAILSSMSVMRPVGWIVSSFLQARHQTKPIMVLEIAKLGLLLGLIAALSVWGPYWSAAGVGLGFAAHALASMWFIRRSAGVAIGRMVRAMVGPLLACGPMVGAVLAVRMSLGLAEQRPVLALLVEITVGVVVYALSALVLARRASRDLLGLLRKSFGRQRG